MDDYTEQFVSVSLLGKRSWRPGKGAPTTHYKPGIHKMPISQVRAMGLMNRIVPDAVPGENVAVPSNYLFGGRFNEKLTDALQAAGIANLDEVRTKTRDELMAIDGVGPAAYPQIQQVLGE